MRPTSALPDRCVFRFLTRLVFWLPTGGGFVLLFVLTDSTGEHLSRFRHRSNSFQETVPTWFNVGRYHGIGTAGIEPASQVGDEPLVVYRQSFAIKLRSEMPVFSRLPDPLPT